MTFEDDRAYLVDTMQEEERRRGLKSTIFNLLQDSYKQHFLASKSEVSARLVEIRIAD